MIIRFNPKATLVLAGSFVACVLAIGLPYWSLRYSQVNLPNSLFGFGLLLVCVLTIVIRAADLAGFFSTWAVMAAVAPFVTLARIVYDTSVDPTSHNLWPFEVVIAGGVGLFVAFAGALVGTLLGLARKKRSTPLP